MPEKTYVSRKLNLSLSRPVPGIASGSLKDSSIHFEQGLLVTEDEGEQKFIEGLDLFKDGTIALQTADSLLLAAKVKAQNLRSAADAAVKAANDADAEVKALSKAPAKA